MDDTVFYTFSTSDKHSDLTGPKLTFTQTFCIQSKLRVFRLVSTWFHARELTKEPRIPLQMQTGTICAKFLWSALWKHLFFSRRFDVLIIKAKWSLLLPSNIKRLLSGFHSEEFELCSQSVTHTIWYIATNTDPSES